MSKLRFKYKLLLFSGSQWFHQLFWVDLLTNMLDWCFVFQSNYLGLTWLKPFSYFQFVKNHIISVAKSIPLPHFSTWEEKKKKRWEVTFNITSIRLWCEGFCFRAIQGTWMCNNQLQMFHHIVMWCLIKAKILPQVSMYTLYSLLINLHIKTLNFP